MIGVDAWSDEAAFAAGIAGAEGSGITGICGSGIVEVVAEMFLAGIVTEDGVVDGALAARTPRIVPDGRTLSILHEGDGSPRSTITQTDVRAIQLAKAALYAGRPAADGPAGHRRTRRDPPRRRVRHADRPHPRDDPRADPGLRPRPRPLSRQRGRNGGPHRAPSGAARREIEGVVRRVEKIETAVEPRFQQHFVEAMAFPHKTAAFPELAKVVALPERATPTTAAGVADARNERRRRRAVATPTWPVLYYVFW